MTSTYRKLTVAAGVLLLATLAFAAGAHEPALAARGKQLFSDDFNGNALAQGWGGKPGNWEIAGGAAKASERPEDKHAAVRRHPLAYHDAIFEFSFRLDGARMLALSLNNKNGHVCRLILSPKGMLLQADKPNAKSDLKAERLAVLDTPIEAGKWHTAVVEVHGRRMTAQLDGKQTLSGENARVDVDKTDFGFPVGGVSASLDYVRIYELRAN